MLEQLAHELTQIVHRKKRLERKVLALEKEVLSEMARAETYRKEYWAVQDAIQLLQRQNHDLMQRLSKEDDAHDGGEG